MLRGKYCTNRQKDSTSVPHPLFFIPSTYQILPEKRMVTSGNEGGKKMVRR